MSNVFAFLKNELGSAAIEYGLVAAGVSFAVIAAVNMIGGSLNEKIAFITSKIGN